MQGYEVITSDDHKVGHVVGKDGRLLIVERGTIRKSRYAVPDADDGDYEKEVAAYYGLVDGGPAPETQGYGEVTPQDPARGAEQEGRLAGIEPADEQRARTRETLRPEEGAPQGARGIHQDYWQVKE